MLGTLCSFDGKLQQCLLHCCCTITFCFGQIMDPLPSWNEGAAKQAIVRFINDTTTPGSKDFIIPDDRIAVFDQDGTLWVEQPVYTQFLFAIDAIKSLAATNPEWKNQEPYQTILEGNLEKIKNFNTQDIEKIIDTTHANMSVEEFKDDVQAWLNSALHPRFKKKYTELIYQPMLEVIQYFNKNDYKVYIVSGGGQEFIRAYSTKTYQIPVDHIVGSTGKVKYENLDGKSQLLKLPETLFIDDKSGKPEAIHLFIGKKPVAAFGNSDGDQQMLEWSQAYNGKSIQLLVHHDDDIREYKYDWDSKVGTLSKQLMSEAKKRGWLIVSMKNDWKIIFHEQSCNQP